MTVWLSLVGIATVAVACEAGEDNTDVQVATVSNLPRCDTSTDPDKSAPPEPPNSEQTSSSSSGATGTSSSSGTVDCTTSGSSSSSSSGGP